MAPAVCLQQRIEAFPRAVLVSNTDPGMLRVEHTEDPAGLDPGFHPEPSQLGRENGGQAHTVDPALMPPCQWVAAAMDAHPLKAQTLTCYVRQYLIIESIGGRVKNPVADSVCADRAVQRRWFTRVPR